MLTNSKHMRWQNPQWLSMIFFDSFLWVKFFNFMIRVDSKKNIGHISLQNNEIIGWCLLGDKAESYQNWLSAANRDNNTLLVTMGCCFKHIHIIGSNYNRLNFKTKTTFFLIFCIYANQFELSLPQLHHKNSRKLLVPTEAKRTHKYKVYFCYFRKMCINFE